MKVLGTVSHPASVAPACDCTNLVPIASIVAAHRAPNNDNASIGLASTAAQGSSAIRIDLPCGNHYLSQIATSGALTVNAHGKTALYVDGNVAASGPLTDVVQRRQRLHADRLLPEWNLHGHEPGHLHGARPVPHGRHVQFEHGDLFAAQQGGVAVGPDGSLYIADQANQRVRRVQSVLTGFSPNASTIPFPSKDGREVYLFDSNGRHLQTVSEPGSRPSAHEALLTTAG